MPKVSVVIPTCNRPAMLALCLEKLAPGTQTLDASHYEVIVTDDGNDDAARQLIATKFPFVKWTKGPQRGPAANRNNGARMALGKWLVFTDDDCLPDHQWLALYAKAITDHPVVRAFEGSILPDNRELLKKDMAECPVNETGGCFWSANIMVNRSLFEEIGGFDEQFAIAAQEDQDIRDRLALKTSIIFCKDAIVTHPVRCTSLLRKMKAARKSIDNWMLFSLKSKSFSQTFYAGLKSQLRAFGSNMIKFKLKSAVYNLYVLVIFAPVALLKNEKLTRAQKI